MADLATELVPAYERKHHPADLIDPLDPNLDALLEEWTDDITGVNDPVVGEDLPF
jgi:hypothetical protein